MANIIIKRMGNNKVKVIEIYRKVTNTGLAEAKQVVDELQNGKEIVISLDDTEQFVIDDVIRQFTEVGAYAYEDRYKGIKNSFASALEETENAEQSVDTDISEMTISGVKQKKYTDVGNLGREATMTKLIEAGKVAKELEELSTSKGNIISKISEQKKEMENIREYVPVNNKLWIGPLIVMALSVPLMITIPVGIIVGLVWHHYSAKKYKQNYIEEHSAENNSNAEKYREENIAPLESKLTETSNKIDALYECGKVQEAIDFVGEDLFSYGCIEDLYNLIKSRKADNLKEALNLYDDTLHKARMEEMQAAIQNASEIAAIEATKQTAYTKEIAKSSHQAATAAKATAHHTRQIDRNTRRFR